VAQTITRYGRQGMPIRAVMLSAPGPQRLARQPAAAMATLEELEETAKLVHLSPTPPAAADRKPDQRPAPDLWRPLVDRLRPTNLNSEEK
jgi:hypothetical protein